MKASETQLKGCFILEPTIFNDDRGYFFEAYSKVQFEKLTGCDPKFIQDNQSRSTFGVVRGLHMQMGNYSQAKLVRVIEGSVLDVAVDVRPESPTFGQSVSVELSAENQKQLFIPRGFLHGFAVLSDNATFFYKCDNVYHKASENGINPLDESLKINWGIPANEIVLSDKDREAQCFTDFEKALSEKKY